MAAARPDPFKAPILVFSSSPARVFNDLGYLSRLGYLAHVALPPTVLEELGPDLAARVLRLSESYVVRPRPDMLQRAARAGRLQPAETEVLALGLQGLGAVVADDPGLQRAAATLALPAANSLGVLAQLHLYRLQRRPLRDDLAALEAQGLALPAALRSALGGPDRLLLRALQDAALDIDWAPELGLGGAGRSGF